MQISGILDSVFRVMLNFKNTQEVCPSTITCTCILVTSLSLDQQNWNDGSVRQHNMLVLAKGDISISHHFFNHGNQVSWQVSKIKCWNQALATIIDEANHLKSVVFSETAGGDITKLQPPLSVFSFSAENPKGECPMDVTSNAYSINFETGPLKMLLECGGKSLASTFQLWYEDSMIDEISHVFDDCLVRYCVHLHWS